MIVTIQENRFGHLTMTPKRDAFTRRCAKYMRRWVPQHDGTLYLQREDDIEALGLSRRHREDLSHGWPIRVRFDPWHYLVMLGYDAARNVKY